MKKLLLIVAALIAVSIVTSEAQIVTYAGTLTGGTNNIAASSNQVMTNVFTTQYSRMVSIEPVFSLMAAGTSINAIRIDNSLDGANWNIGAACIYITANGTTPVNQITNIDTGGITFWRVGAITNLNAAIMTNIAVVIGKKNGM